jgi:S-formylglutathione hydrolase
MTNINLVSEYKCFHGKVGFYSHFSTTCNGEMRFAVYQPPQATQKPIPVLYFLSGLTCREDNFMIKAGAQQLHQIRVPEIRALQVKMINGI